MGESAGGTWWGRGAGDRPEGEGTELGVRGRRRVWGLTGPLALAISGLVLYLCWWVLWEEAHPASAAARAVREREPGARLRAIQDLERLGPQDPDVALPALIETITDPDEVNRAAAAAAMVSVIQGIRPGNSDASRVRLAIESLILRLGDLRPMVRAEAVQALATIAILWQGGRQFVDQDEIAAAIDGLAEDSDPRARLAAVRGIGVLAYPHSDGPPPRLVAALDDESPEVREAAAETTLMFHRGLARWLPTLLKSLEGARPESRPAYLAVLEKIRPSGYARETAMGMLPALVSGLGSRDPDVRCYVLTSIGEFGPEARALIPTLLTILDDPPRGGSEGAPTGPAASDPVAAAIEALGRVAGGGVLAGPTGSTEVPPAAEVLPALMKMLRSPVTARRAAAARALRGFAPDGGVIAALVGSCRDPDATVREAAFWALPDGSPGARAGALDAMREALEDGSPRVRGAAAVALYRSGAWVEPMVAALIRHAERDPDRAVRETCANVLGSLHPPAITAAVVPRYIEAIARREEPALLRGNLIEGLTRLGPGAGAAVPAIAGALRRAGERAGREPPPHLPLSLDVAPLPAEERAAELEARWRVISRLNAVRALGRLGPGSPSAGDAVSALAAALEDPVDEVRQQAIEALAAFGPAARASSGALIRSLRRAQARKDLYRCGRIVEVLGQIDPEAPGAGEAVGFLAEILHSEELGPRVFAERVLGSYGPSAAPAVPGLVALIRRPDPRPQEEGAAIASALGRIAPGSPGEGPALEALLEWLRADLRPPHLEAVIGALARFGPAAAPALPRLRAVSNSADPGIARAARAAVAALEAPGRSAAYPAPASAPASRGGSPRGAGRRGVE